MQFIVLDLEWNQPLSYNSTAYKSSGGKLIFEMIQIGAVKLNENREVIDSFSQLIQPTQYIRLHPRIKRITQISQDDLADAPQFPEALQLFETWCGDDYALLTWGCDDISVLNQNITFFECESHLGAIYDMQRLFGEITGEAKERKGLKAAMDHYEIVPSDDKAFHNAVNDAYYTALVFAKFPDPEKVLNYPLKAKQLLHTEKRRKTALSVVRVTKSRAESLESTAAQHPSCPICGKKQELSAGYLKQGDDRYTALAQCPDHGLYFIKLHFDKNEEGKRIMERAVSLSEEQSTAYVHTKLLQWQNKLEAQQSAESSQN